MTGRRLALIVANDEYEHDGLRQLRSPAADATALADVLGDPTIADFEVAVVHNAPAYQIAAQIEDHFTDSKPEDLLLLHFSCHGLKNEAGELFFAATNTRPDRLGSTAVAADFIQRCMRSSRARQMVLFLDCCYGGAFAQGVSVRASGSANVLEAFPARPLGGGRGRAVISASSSMQYSFEGAELADDHQQPSVFTAALVHGLRTGEADRDQDGRVSLNELYDYVFDKVQEHNPNQTPTRDFELQGELYLAHSNRKRVLPAPLPRELAAAVHDDSMFARLGAVGELRSRLSSSDLPTALAAFGALNDIARNDIRYVADSASEAIASAAMAAADTSLDFGEVDQGRPSAALPLRLVGPAIAVFGTAAASEPWIHVAPTAGGFDVSVDTDHVGTQRGSVTVSGPTGGVAVDVSVRVIASGVPEVEPETSVVAVQQVVVEPEVAPDAPALTEGEVGEPEPEPVVAKDSVVVTDESHTEPESQPRARPQPETEARGFVGVSKVAADATAATPPRALETSTKLVAGAALATGLLLLAVLMVKFRYGDHFFTQATDLVVVVPVLGIGSVACAAGLLAPRTQALAEGVLVSFAVVATWLLSSVVGRSVGADGFQTGWVLAVIGSVALLLAGTMAGLRLARSGSLAVHRPRGWPAISMLVATSTGVVAMSVQAVLIDRYGWTTWFVVETLWVAAIAFVLPVLGVSLSSQRVGLGVLVGWLTAGAGIWVHYAQVLDDQDKGLAASTLFAVTLVIVAALTGLARGRFSAADTAPDETGSSVGG